METLQHMLGLSHIAAHVAIRRFATQLSNFAFGKCFWNIVEHDFAGVNVIVQIFQFVILLKNFNIFIFQK